MANELKRDPRVNPKVGDITDGIICTHTVVSVSYRNGVPWVQYHFRDKSTNHKGVANPILLSTWRRAQKKRTVVYVAD